tara:strand:+ start:377 stop:940 length:564 start_codon:yes stop_codon:yes gene_type:complete
MSKNDANINGLKFERDTRLIEAINNCGLFNVKIINRTKLHPGGEVYSKDKNELLAEVFHGDNFYKLFLEAKYGIKWMKGFSVHNRLSKKLKPDEALVNYTNNHIYIIEKKYQGGVGSIDEKLQTCRFKLMQYKKLIDKTGFTISYTYLLSSFYNNRIYSDVYAFIHDEKCHYFFDEIPLEHVGLFVK